MQLFARFLHLFIDRVKPSQNQFKNYKENRDETRHTNENRSKSKDPAHQQTLKPSRNRKLYRNEQITLHSLRAWEPSPRSSAVHNINSSGNRYDSLFRKRSSKDFLATSLTTYQDDESLELNNIYRRLSPFSKRYAHRKSSQSFGKRKGERKSQKPIIDIKLIL